jgi:hypothetical protein
MILKRVSDTEAAYHIVLPSGTLDIASECDGSPWLSHARMTLASSQRGEAA